MPIQNDEINLLNMEEDRVKKITVQGLDFKISWITPKHRRSITNRRVQLVKAGIEQLTQEEYFLFESMAIVDVCTEEFPKCFKEYASCENWSDVNLIYEVANAIREHTNDLEAKLKKNRLVTGSDEG